MKPIRKTVGCTSRWTTNHFTRQFKKRHRVLPGRLIWEFNVLNACSGIEKVVHSFPQKTVGLVPTCNVKKRTHINRFPPVVAVFMVVLVVGWRWGYWLSTHWETERERDLAKKNDSTCHSNNFPQPSLPRHSSGWVRISACCCSALTNSSDEL